MGSATDADAAAELLRRAFQAQLSGDFATAALLYQRSIAAFPTAEAHTFLGWTYSFQRRLDEAIEECHKAIAVDPTFGNPYNDIGSYLIKQGQLDEAVEWLEKAKAAPRYEPRHFPYMNLGRIYARKGMVGRAIAELECAVEMVPGEPSCLSMLTELRGSLN